MFKMIHHHRGRLFTLWFTGPQLLRIFNGADWRDKLDWVVEAYKDTLKPIGFSPSSVGYILYSLGWKEKIAFAKAHYIDRIACLGFSPFDFAILVTCGTWQEKIQYLEQHHERLNNTGFTLNGIIRIMKSRDWKNRMAWIEKDFPTSEYSTIEAQRILMTKQWRTKLCRR